MKTTISKIILVAVTLISLANPTMSQRQDNDRGHLFKWGKYAMFIHWGLYSQLGAEWNGKTYYGIAEWIKHEANIDKDEYKSLARNFNPTDFDAMRIAQLAKDAGMKYIIITSKHHDGFAMFHSQSDKFNIYDATPFHRDPMKELADACHRLGLGFGFYYSQFQDWTCPGGGNGPQADSNANPVTFDEYFRAKCIPQVEEITKNYGQIELIWFDTPGNMQKKYSEELVELVHKNQPHAMVSSRVGSGLGDYETLGDMEVPIENHPGLWEGIDVTNDTWGFSKYDKNWKSPKQIVKTLVSTIARGGTFMMNIGPDGMGNIPEYAELSLRTSGKWVANHEDMIRAGEPSPWKHALPWGDVIKKENKLYLAVYEWPTSGNLYLPGLKSTISSAKLDNVNGQKAQKLQYTNKDGWTIFQLPATRPNELVNVIELTFNTKDIEVDSTQSLDPDFGSAELSTLFGKPEGCTVRKSGWMEKFGEWKNIYISDDIHKGGKISWTVDVKTPGVYQTEVKAKGNSRVVWQIETDEGEIAKNQQATSSIFGFKPVGWIKFNRPGKHTISITMPEKADSIELAAIRIIPIEF